MTYKGHIKNGVVVLDEPVQLPEGAEVEVQPVATVEDMREEALSKPRCLQEIADMAVDADLPGDFSTQFAHYTKGFARR